MHFSRFIAFLSLSAIASVAFAETYLISPDAVTDGDKVIYNRKTYTVGVTAFATPKALMDAGPVENSTVNVAPGTYADAFTVSVPGLKFMGPNAYIDMRAQSRNPAAVFTARITVNANSTEFNGLDFNGNGQIYNNKATRENPLSGLKFIWNLTDNCTLERKNNNALIRMGKAASDATANDQASRLKYVDINIQHNIFRGTTAPNFIQLCGASGTTTISDNKFNSGATAIRLDNVVGDINIKHNKFMETGQSTLDLGGDFCVQINRSAAEGSTSFNIYHNYFRNCVGQTSLYPVIRFYPGKAGADDVVTPVNCAMNIKYNVFKGKTKVHADYNYLYYADKGTSGDVKTDIRFNTFDRTDYQFAFANRPGQTDLQRFYSSAYGPVDTKNCTFGTFQEATTTKASTVLQSFDYNPATGDIFYIQLTGGAASNGDPKPLVITRLKPDGSQSKMTLTWAGHGTNMAVAQINGKPYIFTGGRATMKSDNSETRADACCWFRYVGGASADLRNESFSYNGTSYPIAVYDREGKNNEYPAVDEVSRLFCSRTTGTNKNYYQIFDLDDMLADPAKATAIATVTINKGDDPTSNSADNGYNTWDHQGYTIHGDYLYILEGVGTESSTATNGKPTIWLHVYDWRRKQFVFRRHLTDNTLMNNTHGEPEGVKVRLNSEGKAEILLGIAVGSSGARKAVIYKYTPNDADFSISNAVHTADTESISLTTTSGVPVSTSVTISNSNLHGGVTTPISGSKQFSVSKSKANCWNEKTTATVTYTPLADTKQHSGYLRVASPMALDLVIPITAVNTAVTGVANISADPAGEPTVVMDGNNINIQGLSAVSMELYNAITGQLIDCVAGSTLPKPETHGIYILRFTTLGNHHYTRKLIL